MAKSSINIQAASAHCFAHNDRSDKVTYLIDDSKLNECSASKIEAKQSLELMIKSAEQYRRNHGLRAMKSDTVKAVEAVVNLNAGHSLADVERLANRIEEEFGFRAVQIAVHRDEGRITEDGRKEKNYHAHIVMCNLTPEGTTIQRTLKPKDMARLQDITAETLGMERGDPERKAKRLNHREYKIVAQDNESKDAEILMLRQRAEDAEKRTEMALEALKTSQATIEAQKAEIERLKANIDDLARMRNEDREKLKATGTATPADYSALKKAHDELKAEATTQIKTLEAAVASLTKKTPDQELK